MSAPIKHFATDELNPDKPHKQGCVCGKWFYRIDRHVECANNGCHPEQYHDASFTFDNKPPIKS